MDGRQTGVDMLLQEADDRRKAAAAALKGSEQARLAGEQKLSALQGQMDAVIVGFAELFPQGGWKTGEHPELGDMTEEFASSVLTKVKQLVASISQQQEQMRKLLRDRETEHNAARLSVAVANLRAGHLRKFLEPENLAEQWYAAYRAYNVSHGVPTKQWQDLTSSERVEIIVIARTLSQACDEKLAQQDQETDEMVQSLLDDGDELSTAIQRLTVITDGVKMIWGSVSSVIRAMSAAGVNILPPGTIVHGVSTSPHRPE